MFVDKATIRVKAGKGGNGLTSFRREKFVSKGGPDGGDGGDGGDVIMRVDHNVNTLAKFRYSREVVADNGENGKKRKAHGKSGKDKEIVVPEGTVVYDGNLQLADLKQVGDSVVLARGGRGGFGNAHFTSSTRQAPRMAELGEAGEEKTLRLELKIVADIGLAGLPNAGKSTFLSVVSNAKPEIADYPFTTLAPNLGVVDLFEDSLVVADIPGLIAGASEGRGLGYEFLRHIERTKVLLHLIDSTQENAAKAYRTIQKELASYQIDLTAKPQFVALTKSDAVDDKLIKQHRKDLRREGVETVHVISSIAHKGLDQVLKALYKAVMDMEPPAGDEVENHDMPTITLDDDPNAWQVKKDGSKFIIMGQKIGKFAERTDFSNREAMQRLRDIFHKQGIDRELDRFGIRPDDTVSVGGKEFKW